MTIINILDRLNDFARENTFLSIIILAVIGNLATDLIKKIFLKFIYQKSIHLISKGSKAISSSAKRNIEFLISFYQGELEKVESIKNQNKNVILKLLEDVYFNLTLLFILVIILLITYKVTSASIFYGLLGGGALTLFRLIYGSTHTMSLFKKARSFDQYHSKVEKKITAPKRALEKS